VSDHAPKCAIVRGVVTESSEAYELSNVVETALARALVLAAEAKRWDVVVLRRSWRGEDWETPRPARGCLRQRRKGMGKLRRAGLVLATHAILLSRGGAIVMVKPAEHRYAYNACRMSARFEHALHRNSLPNSLMRSRDVEIEEAVLPEHSLEVTLAQNDHVIEALSVGRCQGIFRTRSS